MTHNDQQQDLSAPSVPRLVLGFPDLEFGRPGWQLPKARRPGYFKR